jgi:6-phosphofructokinase 1
MKRIAILTAGGDTPSLNATIHGAVTRANERRIEVVGLMRGFDALLHPRLPHVLLNPLFSVIPELDPHRGGTILGASRKYIGRESPEAVADACQRLKSLEVDGLICVGGDGTMNGLQPICGSIPAVLAPKTIDNDLGLNFPGEPQKWKLEPADGSLEAGDNPDTPAGMRYVIDSSVTDRGATLRLDQMVNYVTPGYATAVFVSAGGVQRVRTTAESHRRVAIIEVMGRYAGFIALGSAYGQPDIILIPEFPIDVPKLVQRVKDVYRRQYNVVIVCGEGVVDIEGRPLGASKESSDPVGNVVLTGAAERLRRLLVDEIGDKFFQDQARKASARRSIFTRKVGHTQRGGRPVAFDRFHAAQLGGKAMDMLLEGQNNAMATLSWNQEHGFRVDSCPGSVLRDRFGVIHPRQVHPSFYDEEKLHISDHGAEYLLPIFTNAISADDMEHLRQTIFDSGNLFRGYHSVVRDIEQRVQYL